MTTKQNSAPEKEANRLTTLWQKHGPNTYPLDIDALIEGAIRTSDFRGELLVQRGSFDSFEGCLLRHKKTQSWTIMLNDAVENKRRQRFTFAHELGHFMCHRLLQDSFEDGDKNLNDYRTTLEREANVFASCLLLPANLVRDEYCSRPWTAELLCDIGSRFESSLQASALRFVKLSHKPIAFVVSRDGMILWSCRSKTSPYLRAYKFGDELPVHSAEIGLATSPLSLTSEAVPSGNSWNDLQCCKESHYIDRSGQGYQYTCIEFTG